MSCAEGLHLGLTAFAGGGRGAIVGAKEVQIALGLVSSDIIVDFEMLQAQRTWKLLHDGVGKFASVMAR